MQNVVYISSLALAALISLALSVFVWRRRAAPGAGTFLTLLALLTWLSLTELVSALSASTEAAGFWFAARYLSLSFLPVVCFMFSLWFTGRQRWITPLLYILLCIVPLATQLAIWIPGLQGLWGRMVFVRSGYILLIAPALSTAGPWFWVHTAYSYLVTAAYSVLLVIHSIGSFRIYRMQSLAMLGGLAVMLAASLWYTFDLLPGTIVNPTPIGIAVSCSLFAWAMFRYRLLDMKPLARDIVFDTMRDGVIVMDGEKHIVDFNPAAGRMTALTPAAIGTSLASRDDELLRRVLTLCGEETAKADIELADPANLSCEATASPVRDRKGSPLGWVATLHDITERARLFRQVESLATVDSLTGALNRRCFLERAEQELYRCRRDHGYAIAVLMMDLDHFKAINDAYGHAPGDRVLEAVSEKVRGLLRKTDLFGRLGGEEFAVLLSDVHDDGMPVAERIRVAVEAIRIGQDDASFGVTASLGVVSSLQLDSADFDIARMLSLADRALYQAKEGGRNRVVMATR